MTPIAARAARHGEGETCALDARPSLLDDLCATPRQGRLDREYRDLGCRRGVGYVDDRWQGSRKGQYAIDGGVGAGTRVPVHCAAAGKTLLASLPAAEQAERMSSVARHNIAWSLKLAVPPRNRTRSSRSRCHLLEIISGYWNDPSVRNIDCVVQCRPIKVFFASVEKCFSRMGCLTLRVPDFSSNGQGEV